ncbi:MAG: acyltransferase family protein [Psychromonas sp.]|nr:acyltransferase family protein [Psychromonas sp.]
MRLNGVELFRLFAIFGVIIIHSSPFSEAFIGTVIEQLSRFGVPFFFLVSGYFFVLNVENKKEKTLDIAFRQIKKIIFIYAIWYVVYDFWSFFTVDSCSDIRLTCLVSTFKEQFQILIDELIESNFIHLLTGGRAYHLWFLPSLAIALLLLAFSLKYNFFKIGMGGAIFLFVITLLNTPYRDTAIGIDIGITNSRNGPFFSSIFVFLGAAIARYQLVQSRMLASLPTAIFICLIGFVAQYIEAEVLSMYTNNGDIISFDFILFTIPFAVGSFLISLHFKSANRIPGVFIFSRLTLGVYLVHVLVMRSLSHFEFIETGGVVKPILIFIVSMLFAELLRRVPKWKLS